jgi:hypothetical protein
VSGSIAKRHAPERESEDDGMAARGPEAAVNVDVEEEVAPGIDSGIEPVP